jgi:hypothetical protein
VSEAGSIRPPLFVVDSVPGEPIREVGVNVNVAEGAPVDRVTVDGENVPAIVISGVMTTPLDKLPYGVSATVKLDDGTLIEPLAGPDRV